MGGLTTWNNNLRKEIIKDAKADIISINEAHLPSDEVIDIDGY